MSSNIDYAEAAKQAEAAVASVKDSELKGIAFGKILDALLGQQGQAKAPSAAKLETRQSQKALAKPAKRKGGPKHGCPNVS